LERLFFAHNYKGEPSSKLSMVYLAIVKSTVKEKLK
jgi:hypothetical protein